MFKKANKLKLRFETSRGLLSAEQLWDLPLEELDALAVSLEEVHAESGKKSFLVKRSTKDATAKLRFSIVVAVLEDKVADANKASTAADNKAHNEKILGLIANKQDETLAGKSVEELEAMLK